MELVLGHNDARQSDNNDLTFEKKNIMIPTHVNATEPNEMPKYTPRYSNSRVMIVTTSQSFETQVEKAFTTRWHKMIQGNPYKNRNGIMVTPKPHPSQQTYNQLVMSSVWRDEAHLERLSSSATINLISGGVFRLPHNQSVHFNIMSGTLLTTGPSDIAQYLKIMQRPSCEQDPELRKWMGNEAADIGKKWDKLIKIGKVTENNIAQVISALRLLLETLLLRFTPRSQFLRMSFTILRMRKAVREIRLLRVGSAT